MICNLEPDYDDTWNLVSAECKDFVKKLLVKDYSHRMTAKIANFHPWIKKNKEVMNIKKK